MRGTTEWLIRFGVLAVYLLAVYSAVRRLQRKLGAEAKPTVWMYANELGGYIVVGVILVIVVAASVLFSD